MSTRAYILVFLSLVLVNGLIGHLFNRIVPEPYMDEIFHVPQAQQYCRGRFHEWDPMITTFPGLYILSTAYIHTTSCLLPPLLKLLPPSLLANLTSPTAPLSGFCSTPILRSLNILLSSSSFLLLHALTVEITKRKDAQRRTVPQDAEAALASPSSSPWMFAAAMYLFPLHWFFSFLFYTDVGSTLLVLSAYLACLRRKLWSCAALAALSVLFRQTNAVWALFFACIGAAELLSPRRQHGRPGGSVDHPGQGTRQRGASVDPPGQGKRQRGEPWGPYESADNRPEATTGGLRRRVGTGPERPEIPKIQVAETVDRQPIVDDAEEKGDPGVFWGLVQLAASALARWRDVLFHLGPLILVVALFVIFVILNKGVVVGARNEHQMSLHLAQLPYFAAFSAGCLWPLLLSPSLASHLTRAVLYTLRSPRLLLLPLLGWLSTAAFTYAAVHKFSLAHPYLLADNRHYPFYIWRRVVNRSPTAKYMLIPFYLYCTALLTVALRKRVGNLWLFFFVMATAGVLVPAPLIEFRYYIVPFMILMLNMTRCLSRGYIMLVIASFAFVNAFVIYVFLYKPYQWTHEPGKLQRIMW